jgi:hypothetical protein
MGSRVGVDCVVFAETVDPIPVRAEVELVDTEVSPIAVALDFFRV